MVPIAVGRRSTLGLNDQAAGSERIGNPQLIINDLPVL